MGNKAQTPFSAKLENRPQYARKTAIHDLGSIYLKKKSNDSENQLGKEVDTPIEMIHLFS